MSSAADVNWLFFSFSNPGCISNVPTQEGKEGCGGQKRGDSTDAVRDVHALPRGFARGWLRRDPQSTRTIVWRWGGRGMVTINFFVELSNCFCCSCLRKREFLSPWENGCFSGSPHAHMSVCPTVVHDMNNSFDIIYAMLTMCLLYCIKRRKVIIEPLCALCILPEEASKSPRKSIGIDEMQFQLHQLCTSFGVFPNRATSASAQLKS